MIKKLIAPTLLTLAILAGAVGTLAAPPNFEKGTPPDFVEGEAPQRPPHDGSISFNKPPRNGVSFNKPPRDGVSFNGMHKPPHDGISSNSMNHPPKAPREAMD